ncbi:MAG: PilZ domain-containing protein [Sphingomicrobium sp.]
MEHGPSAKRGIADGLRRLLDQRDEERSDSGSQTAVLTHDGNRHVVGILNLSPSGAMLRFRGALANGDQVVLQLLDQGTVTGQVRWVSDGRVGVAFATAFDGAKDQ